MLRLFAHRCALAVVVVATVVVVVVIVVVVVTMVVVVGSHPLHVLSHSPVTVSHKFRDKTV